MIKRKVIFIHMANVLCFIRIRIVMLIKMATTG